MEYQTKPETILDPCSNSKCL